MPIRYDGERLSFESWGSELAVSLDTRHPKGWNTDGNRIIIYRVPFSIWPWREGSPFILYQERSCRWKEQATWSNMGYYHEKWETTECSTKVLRVIEARDENTREGCLWQPARLEWIIVRCSLTGFIFPSLLMNRRVRLGMNLCSDPDYAYRSQSRRGGGWVLLKPQRDLAIYSRVFHWPYSLCETKWWCWPEE